MPACLSNAAGGSGVLGRPQPRPRPRARPRASAAAQASAAAASPDLVVLPARPGRAAIHLFGVDHHTPSSDCAEFIAAARPAAVVVETALNEAQGAATGARFDPALFDPRDRWGPMYLRLAAELRSQVPAPVSGAPPPLLLDAPQWARLRGSLGPEPLAYVAALAVDAPLIFGDRPKAETYRRLLAEPAAALDVAFGRATCRNYFDLLQGLAAPGRPLDPALAGMTSDEGAAAGADDVILRVLVQERDACLAAALVREAAAAAAVDLPPAHSSGGSIDGAGGGLVVVGLVGRAHLAGVAAAAGDARTVEQAAVAAGRLADLDAASELVGPAAADWGVRRALLEGCLRLTCPPGVVEDAQARSGLLPAAALAAYEGTVETFATSRMLLACAGRGLLPLLVGGTGGSDFYELLSPVRACRPSRGGAGFDPDVLAVLRALDFELG